MTLVYGVLTVPEIIQLAQKDDYKSELEKMSFDQLETISKLIPKIITEEMPDFSLKIKLMNLRIRIMLVMWST
jgi:hypothetical protein